MDKFTPDRSHRGPSPLTFPDILSDPLVRAVMAADHVDPNVLAADLGHIARLLPKRPSADTESGCCRAC